MSQRCQQLSCGMAWHGMAWHGTSSCQNLSVRIDTALISTRAARASHLVAPTAICGTHPTRHSAAMLASLVCLHFKPWTSCLPLDSCVWCAQVTSKPRCPSLGRLVKHEHTGWADADRQVRGPLFICLPQALCERCHNQGASSFRGLSRLCSGQAARDFLCFSPVYDPFCHRRSSWTWQTSCRALSRQASGPMCSMCMCGQLHMSSCRPWVADSAESLLPRRWTLSCPLAGKGTQVRHSENVLPPCRPHRARARPEVLLQECALH